MGEFRLKLIDVYIAKLGTKHELSKDNQDISHRHNRRLHEKKDSRWKENIQTFISNPKPRKCTCIVKNPKIGHVDP